MPCNIYPNAWHHSPLVHTRTLSGRRALRMLWRTHEPMSQNGAGSNVTCCTHPPRSARSSLHRALCILRFFVPWLIMLLACPVKPGWDLTSTGFSQSLSLPLPTRPCAHPLLEAPTFGPTAAFAAHIVAAARSQRWASPASATPAPRQELLPPITRVLAHIGLICAKPRRHKWRRRMPFETCERRMQGGRQASQCGQQPVGWVAPLGRRATRPPDQPSTRTFGFISVAVPGAAYKTCSKSEAFVAPPRQASPQTVRARLRSPESTRTLRVADSPNYGHRRRRRSHMACRLKGSTDAHGGRNPGSRIKRLHTEKAESLLTRKIMGLIAPKDTRRSLSHRTQRLRVHRC